MLKEVSKDMHHTCIRRWLSSLRAYALRGPVESYAAQLISQTKAFVINVPSKRLLKEL
ncbi:MAG: hypothetical protein ABR903_00565 [Thermodesulfovibrionales bacterium]